MVIKSKNTQTLLFCYLAISVATQSENIKNFNPPFQIPAFLIDPGPMMQGQSSA